MASATCPSICMVSELPGRHPTAFRAPRISFPLLSANFPTITNSDANGTVSRRSCLKRANSYRVAHLWLYLERHYQPHRRSSRGGALGASCGLDLSSTYSLNWIFTVGCMFLMLTSHTGVYKQLLVPLLALHLPTQVVSALRAESGLWGAFLAVLVRLFYGIPGQLELPLATVLLVVTAPPYILGFRREAASALVGLALAAYIAYEHFKETDGLTRATQSEKLPTTISVLAVFLIPLVFSAKRFAR